MNISPEVLQFLVIQALSALIEFFPPFKVLWDKLDNIGQGEDGEAGMSWKPIIFLLVGAILLYAGWGVACLGIDLGFGVYCVPKEEAVQNAVNIARLLLVTYAVNQGAYKGITALSKKVQM